MSCWVKSGIVCVSNKINLLSLHIRISCIFRLNIKSIYWVLWGLNMYFFYDITKSVPTMFFSAEDMFDVNKLWNIWTRQATGRDRYTECGVKYWNFVGLWSSSDMMHTNLQYHTRTTFKWTCKSVMWVSYLTVKTCRNNSSGDRSWITNSRKLFCVEKKKKNTCLTLSLIRFFNITWYSST